MRVLNVLLIKDEVPQIIEAFPVFEEQLSEEVIDKAESYICNLVFGPKTDSIFSEDEFFDVMMHAYTIGVRRPDGAVYYLLWSDIES